uniref:Uncharacterized LOC100183163 n=1 Tax=Ciona intestinalis TaxID=7719 RepID=H2XYF1_CIOIN|nr:uncharacterized protein LOC100183163 [Ciona intestinalis]|eukprot:XP_002126645.1 uncharacterized protein LOC100183163 [Ciona intestinalis]
MADRTVAISSADSGVGDVAAVATSQIRINLKVSRGDSRLEVNERGNFVAHIEGNVYTITTAIFRQFTVQRLLIVGGSVTAIAYGLHRLGYNAGPFFPGSIAFVISTEPDKERALRRRLENGMFLQELKDEVSDIIQQHSDILGDLKQFNIISCKEIQETQKEGGSVNVKDVKMKDSAFMAYDVEISKGAGGASQASGSEGKSSTPEMAKKVHVENLDMDSSAFMSSGVRIVKQDK